MVLAKIQDHHVPDVRLRSPEGRGPPNIQHHLPRIRLHRPDKQTHPFGTKAMEKRAVKNVKIAHSISKLHLQLVPIHPSFRFVVLGY